MRAISDFVRPVPICLVAVLGARCLFGSGAALAQAEPATLTIHVTGIAEIGGALAIAVFDSEERYRDLEGPIAREFVPVTDTSVTWSAELPGNARYAAVVYHDINGNGELDRGRFGIPSEPYGFSNAARGRLGPPRFAAARFELAGTSTAISIEIE